MTTVQSQKLMEIARDLRAQYDEIEKTTTFSGRSDQTLDRMKILVLEAERLGGSLREKPTRPIVVRFYFQQELFYTCTVMTKTPLSVRKLKEKVSKEYPIGRYSLYLKGTISQENDVVPLGSILYAYI